VKEGKWKEVKYAICSERTGSDVKEKLVNYGT
jgi:hypothetical protein